MPNNEIDRRAVLAGTTALTAAALMPKAASAQSSGASLPARGEFVIRGAHVLSMDPAIGDLENGTVHVRDGSIVAVGASVNAPGAQAIEG